MDRWMTGWWLMNDRGMAKAIRTRSVQDADSQFDWVTDSMGVVNVGEEVEELYFEGPGLLLICWHVLNSMFFSSNQDPWIRALREERQLLLSHCVEVLYPLKGWDSAASPLEFLPQSKVWTHPCMTSFLRVLCSNENPNSTPKLSLTSIASAIPVLVPILTAWPT